MKMISFFKYLSIVLGILIATLGATVLIGWHIQSNFLVQMRPDMLPMVYNGALCFLLSGIALILLNQKEVYLNVTILISILLFSANLLTLSQYIFSIDLHIDTMFAFPFNADKQTDVGRMAPNTALSFIFTAIAIFFLSMRRNRLLKYSVGLFCSFSILIFSLICLFSYFANSPSLSFLQKFTTMAPNSAIGFFMLSIGILVTIFHRSEEERYPLSSWAPSIVAGYALVTITLFWISLKIGNVNQIYDFVLNAMYIFGLALSVMLFFTLRYAHMNRLRLDEISKTREAFERAQQLVHLGIWVWDLKSNLIWCSSEALRILGQPLDNDILTLDKCLEILKPEDREDFMAAFSKMVTHKGGLLEIQNTIHVAGAEKIIQHEAKITKFNMTSPIEITGIIQDVTDTKLLEKQLLQAQKMEVLGQLTGGLAHDFNNILMLVSGNIELLDKEIKLDEPHRKRLMTVLSAVEKGSQITARLLGFSRQQTLKPEKVNLAEMLPNFTKMIHPVLGEAIEISISCPSDLWSMWVDPNQLQTAILNLVVNSRDAMNGKGKLFLVAQNYTSNESFKMGKIKIEPGDYVKVSVTDTGEGMSPETIERAFEPFYTTKAVGKGSGLGLSMVYGFVNQSKGVISIYSEYGHGTTINLYFPRVKDKQGDEKRVLKTRQSDQPSTELKKLKILVVEDDDALRKVTVDYLTVLGNDVASASNGPEALAHLKQSNDIDLLLSDVIMPGGMTGVDLAITANKLRKNIKILLVTGYAKETLSFENLPEGFHPEIMMKPYSFSDLKARIKQMFEEPPI